jgi:hypothetical protein
MSTVARLFISALLCLLSLSGRAAAPATASNPPPLAQSALLTVRASVTNDWLTLHIEHSDNQSPVVSKDVTVSVAGHAAPVMAGGNGTYTIPVRQLGSSTQPVLDIIVGHDGIREILSGKLALPAAPAPSEGSHKQMLWWVLNIAIVFAAAMFLSRKKPAS